MATTTNYGWTTPDDTALVKDGASAIRTLGSSVDTTVKNLNPETTTGDISYRSSTSNVNTRLALGTAEQVLAINSGTTAPEWKTIVTGGLTLLSTTSLSGATTSISSISGSYNSLLVYIYGATNATADGAFRIAPNGSTNTTYIIGRSGNSSAANDSYVFYADYLKLGYTNILRTASNNFYSVLFPNYANTTYSKTFFGYGQYTQTDTALVTNNYSGVFNSTSALTSLTFSNSGGDMSTGTVLIYGVN